MLNTSFKLLAIAAIAALVSGCISEEKQLEGVSLSGGNAIAHNTALQIVDPWPNGVHKTNLVVPASRSTNPANAAPTAPAPVVAGN